MQHLGTINERWSKPLHNILVVKVSDSLDVDFMGPFPPNSFSFHYILVGVDRV